MPNIKSQEKRDRQNKKRELKNKIAKSKIKTETKKFIQSVEKSNNIEEAEKNLSTLFNVLDSAAKKSAVHKNFAANKKSKAAKFLNSVKSK